MFTCCMTKEKEDDDGTESKNILRQKTKELEKVMRQPTKKSNKPLYVSSGGIQVAEGGELEIATVVATDDDLIGKKEE